MSDRALNEAAGSWLNDGTKRIPGVGDGDPRDYGGTLPDGRRWSPPYGPARVDRPNPFLGTAPSMDDLRYAGIDLRIQRLHDELEASMRSTRRGRGVWWLAGRLPWWRRVLGSFTTGLSRTLLVRREADRDDESGRSA